MTDGARHRRRSGVIVEPIGVSWAAFSPFSGETHLLNDEAAALLEIVDEPKTLAELIEVLVHDGIERAPSLAGTLAGSLVVLEGAGLIETV